MKWKIEKEEVKLFIFPEDTIWYTKNSTELKNIYTYIRIYKQIQQGCTVQNKLIEINCIFYTLAKNNLKMKLRKQSI